MSLAFGDTLKNGAKVILANSRFVLAYAETSYQPFVTWERDAVDPLCVGSGHYFSSLSEAGQDYNERSKSKEF